MRGVVVAGATLAALLQAAGAAAAPRPVTPDSAQVTVLPAPVRTVQPGTTDTLLVTLRVAPGLHVQANPAAEAFLIPLRLDLDAPPGIEPGPIIYPPPRIHRLDGTGDELWVCEGTVVIAVPVSVVDGFPDSSALVRGTLSWQACDAKRCFAPRRTPVELRVSARR